MNSWIRLWITGGFIFLSPLYEYRIKPENVQVKTLNLSSSVRGSAMDCCLNIFPSSHFRSLQDFTPEAFFQWSHRQTQRLKTKTHYLSCSSLSSLYTSTVRWRKREITYINVISLSDLYTWWFLNNSITCFHVPSYRTIKKKQKTAE